MGARSRAAGMGRGTSRRHGDTRTDGQSPRGTTRHVARPLGAPCRGYVGRRVAGPRGHAADVRRCRARSPHRRPATVEIPTVFSDTTTGSLRPAVPGKRRAAKAPRRPCSAACRRCRSSSASPCSPSPPAACSPPTAPSSSRTGAERRAVSPPRTPRPARSARGVYDALGRSPIVSRDSDRDALDDASEATLVARGRGPGRAAQRGARQPGGAGREGSQDHQLNRWSLPIDAGVYRLSATFGQAGYYWSSGYHTGLDFAAPSGTPIMAVANGVVTSVGYEGAYGNQTIVTLEDGTEIWYCHQTSYDVSVGDNVVAGPGHRLRRLDRQLHRPAPPPRGPPRRRRPGRPVTPRSWSTAPTRVALRASRPAHSAAAAA